MTSQACEGKSIFSRLEVAGASYATVFDQWIAIILAVIFNFKYNTDIHLDVRRMRPNGPIIKGTRRE